MKRLLLFFVLIASCVSGSNGNDLPRYHQQLVIEFASEKEAQEAELTMLELPPGKTLAVGARWDDTTKAHLLMSKALSENGWKGSFFTNRIDKDYVDTVVRRLHKDGSSIGAHSMTHPHLETQPVNIMFYELLGNRVILETATDQVVTSFTFPFGLRSNKESLSSAEEQGEALVRTGIKGGPERLGMAKKLGLTSDQFLSPHMFAANDRDPNPTLFAQGFKAGLQAIQQGRSDCGPYIVLGVHSWQNSVHKDGFDRLSKILATESNKPNYWYCNSNEYIAWRLAFLKTKITKKAVNGTKVTFQLERIEPAELGALLDLGLKITPTPLKDSQINQSIQIDSQGQFMLANEAKHNLPKIIGRIDNKDNSNEKSESLTSPKIPEIQFGSRIDLKNNKLYVSFKNNSNKTVENLRFVLRLPLQWEKGVLRSQLSEKLGPGKSHEKEISLPAQRSDEKYRKGDLFVDNECDFTLDQTPLRLHSTITVKQK